MKYDYSKLKGLITEKFGSQRNFAKAIGFKETTLSMKLQGKSHFSQSDITRICKCCDISLQDVGDYFFVQIVHR